MTETQNEYREESGAGNHYRTAYHQGLEALLARLQKQSDGLRKQLHKMLLERPEAFRRQIRQSLGWPLTEKREDVPTVKREYVASDETTDIYRMQMEIQPGLWMYGILFCGARKRRCRWSFLNMAASGRRSFAAASLTARIIMI